METTDFDKKPPEEQAYKIMYNGDMPKYFGTIFHLVPFGKLEQQVLVVFQDPNIRPNGTIPDEVKDYISKKIRELGIGHLGLMFPNPSDSFLES